MKFKIKKVVKPLDLADYEEAYGGQEGSIIYVWVNPPYSVREEYDEARKAILEMRNYEGDGLIEKNEEANQRLFEWYSKIWSQKDGHEWPPEEVRELNQQCIEHDIGLWEFVITGTFDLLKRQQERIRKN